VPLCNCFNPEILFDVVYVKCVPGAYMVRSFCFLHAHKNKIILKINGFIFFANFSLG